MVESTTCKAWNSTSSCATLNNLRPNWTITLASRRPPEHLEDQLHWECRRKQFTPFHQDLRDIISVDQVLFVAESAAINVASSSAQRTVTFTTTKDYEAPSKLGIISTKWLPSSTGRLRPSASSRTHISVSSKRKTGTFGSYWTTPLSHPHHSRGYILLLAEQSSRLHPPAWDLSVILCLLTMADY